MAARRTAAVLLACVVVTASVTLGARMLADRQAILPGIEGCRTLQARSDLERCVAGRGAEVIRSKGRVSGLELVERAAMRHDSISGVCHTAMHRAAGRQTMSDINIARKLWKMGGDCRDGYIHAEMANEVRFGDEPDLKAAAELCRPRSAADRERLVAYQCAHGFGHGMRRRGELVPSARRCDDYFVMRLYRMSCVEGVLMEDMWVRKDAIRRSDDIIEPCPDMPAGDLAIACYENVANKAVVLGWTPRRMVKSCEQVSVAAYRTACVVRAGQNLQPATFSLCGGYRDARSRSDCFHGYFNFQIFSTPGFGVSRGRALCDSVRKRFHAECLEQLERTRQRAKQPAR